MTLRTNRMLLATLAASALVVLGAYVALEEVARDPIPPKDVPGLARWMMAHPADWLAATALTDRVLDSPLPRRFEVWRAAHSLATRLSPARPNGAAAFVRSGLFHWYELDAADRGRVLEAAKPLLRDSDTFRQLAMPLWLLTRDLSLLRQVNPGTHEAVGRLREIAVNYGLFDDYRALREETRQARLRTFAADPTNRDFWGLLPRPMEVADTPFIRALLEELRKHPLETTGNVAPLIDFALRHGLGPLDGLAPAVHAEDVPPATRARLARALGLPEVAREIEVRHGILTEPEVPLDEWMGTCGDREICTAATMHVNAGGTMTIGVATVQSDEIPPYVEIFVDDARRAEGAVRDQATFLVPLGEPGLHKIDVRLANPLTRNALQRRVRVTTSPQGPRTIPHR